MRQSRKKMLLFLVLAVQLFTPANGNSGVPPVQYTFRQESAKSIIVEISIPEPQFLKNEETGLSSQVLPGEGAFKTQNDALYGFSKILLLPEGTTAEVFKKGNTEISTVGNLDFSAQPDQPFLKNDVAETTRATSITTSKKSFTKETPLSSTEFSTELQFLGKMRGEPVSSLVVKPYFFKKGQVHFIRTVSLRLISPTAISVHEITQSPVSAFAQRSFKKHDKTPATPLAASFLKKIPAAPDGFNYKIIIDKEGLVRVTAGELLKAGVPLERLNSQTLRLWNKGGEVPIYIHDRNDQKLDAGGLSEEYIEFFGEPNRQYFKNPGRDLYGDPETDDNVYALTWGAGLGKRMVGESGDIKITDQSRMTDLRGQSFTSTVFAEENYVFERFGGTAFTKDTNKRSFKNDQYFWQRVQANQTVQFPVELPHPDLLDEGSMKITAMLYGATDLLKEFSNCSESEEHNAEIYINQRRALRASWSGIRQFQADDENHGVAEIPMGAAANGENTLVTVSNIFNCVETSGVTPVFYVNWLRISYQRLYKAFKNTVPFSIPREGESGLYTFYISEFTRPDIIVYRKGVSRIINFGTKTVKPEATSGETTYTISFQSYVASPDEQFYAVNEDQVLKPKSIVKDRSSSLAESANDYDYIIITDTALYDPLLKEDNSPQNPVVKFKNFKKESQGFKVVIANVSDIFDEFNFGIKSKEALRSFLQYTYNEWQVAPRYAVLAGDAASIPPDYWQTVRWGTTPTDYTYGLIDGYYRASNNEIVDDVFPEIIIGRLPASTKQQLMAIVEKSIMYAENPDLDFYRSSTLLIAGDHPLFEVQTSQLASVVPSSVSVRRLYVRNSSVKYFGGTSSLINELDNGTAYVNYMGHGGGAVWDDKGLFLPADVQRISNRGKYCVVSSPTCFTGAYEGTGGLLTAFIFEKERGAIAAWGNSGYGWHENSYYFSNGLIESFFSKENRGKNIGDLFAEGKARYFSASGGYSNSIAITMLLQCNFLGDPALRFGVAKKTGAIQTEKQFATPGDEISFKGDMPFGSGQGIVELYDEQKNRIDRSEQSVAIVNGKFTGVTKVPVNYTGASIGLRVYANDFTTENEAESSTIVTTDSLIFADAKIVPFPLQNGQPFDIQVKILSRSAVNSVKVIVEITAPDGMVTTDTIAMTSNGDVLKTGSPVSGALAVKGSRITYRFEVSDGVKTSLSRQYSHKIGGMADPAAYARTQGDSLQYVSGTKAVNPGVRIYATPSGALLGAEVFNWGENEARNVEVLFENADSKELYGKTIVSIPAGQKVLAHVPFKNSSFDIQNVRISITAAEGEDAFTGNNSSTARVLLSCYQVAPGIGTTADGVSSSPVGIDGSAEVEVLKTAGISGPELLCLQADTAITTVQPGVRLLKGNGFHSLTISSNVENTPFQGVLKLWYDKDFPEIQNTPPAIYKLNPRLQTWSRVPSAVIEPGLVSANVLLKGTYAVGYSNDISAPNTRISIEGQFFTNLGAVPPSPKISIVATDENGIHTEAEHIILEIDNKKVLKEDFSFVDSSSTATSSGILYEPNLSNGMHTFCISVTDNNGNQSDRDCIQMEVATDFQVRVLGEFPNPFENEMFIAYDILGANTVDEVEVKFYTSSGRTIRTLRYPSGNPLEYLGLKREGSSDPTSVGYHEAWWEGTDENGNEVANGVYFYRIRLRSGEETVEALGKIARVR